MTKPRKINVEPLLFFHAFSFGLASTIGTAFITFKYCLLLLDDRSSEGPLSNSPHDYCLQLGSSGSDNTDGWNNSGPADPSSPSDADIRYLNQVQTATARFSIILEAITTAPTILSTIYIGAWSDRHGRKPPVVLALAGTAIASQIAVITSAVDRVPVYAMIACSLITALTGSILVVYSGAYSMISDCTNDPKYLVIRIALITGLSSIGSLIAQISSALILQYWDDYTLIYLCNSVCTVLAFLYGVYGLQETIQFSKNCPLTPGNTRRSSSSEVSGALDPALVAGDHDDSPADNDIQVSGEPKPAKSRIFSLRVLKECVAILTISRPGKRRLYLLITVFSGALLFVTEAHGVLNLFAKRPPLSMTNSEYSFMTATGSALVFAPILTAWLFKTSDISLLVIGIAFGVFKHAMTAFSTRKWMIFTAMGVGGLSHLYTTGYRSFTTRLVQRNETGRLFAAIGAITHLCPLLGSTICNNIYTATLTWFPGFIFLLSAVIWLIVLLVMSCVYVDIKIRGEDASARLPPPLVIGQSGDSDIAVLVNNEILPEV